MIYTLTLNPAIDCIVHLQELKQGELNRVQTESIRFGGKGINVSVVLKEFGIPSVALGFVAGETGDAIEAGVRSQGIETDFIRLPEGFSRINCKISAGEETEINGSGPEVDPVSLEQLYERLECLTDGDVLVLSGSSARGLPKDIYAQFLKRIGGCGIKSVVDTGGAALKETIPQRPYLIKPNLQELGELFETIPDGRSPEGRDKIVSYMRKLREDGAQNVLVSMGADGAMLLTEDGSVCYEKACPGKACNTVGAGDSMLAAFLSVIFSDKNGNKQNAADAGYDPVYALKLAVAAGAAAAFSDGLAKKEETERLFYL